jgi:spore coat polysaccharide biosynthesis predicted glycosyltransferase SpsG
MRYVLRADASQSIGSGHVMRSSAIGEELIGRGEEVIFVGKFSDVPWLASRINNLGFTQVILEEVEFSSNPETDVLILDSYTIPVEQKFIQRANWKSIVLIADHLTPAYPAHLVIRPGLSFHKESVSNNKLVGGPKYIPFRKSIQRNKTGPISNKILEILVVGGGADSFNFAAAVCEVLKNTQGDFHVSIFTSREDLAELDSRFTAIPIGSELDRYAANCGLVFTTASTTSLEFIAREVAVGIGCAVDNQEEYYQTLSSAGVALPIGEFTGKVWKMNKVKINALVNSGDVREILREKCSGLIDLQGAERIVDEILKI